MTERVELKKFSNFETAIMVDKLLAFGTGKKRGYSFTVIFIIGTPEGEIHMAIPGWRLFLNSGLITGPQWKTAGGRGPYQNMVFCAGNGLSETLDVLLKGLLPENETKGLKFELQPITQADVRYAMPTWGVVTGMITPEPEKPKTLAELT